MKLKCKLQHNLVINFGNDERPELGKSYTIIDSKRVELKGLNKSFLAFKFKEFENNEVFQWFPEDLFTLGKNKLVENFTETI